MVFELAASWDRHFVVTSETCLLDNPTHDEGWQSRARFPVFVLPNQVSPFSQPPISTSPPPNHHGHPSPPVLYFPHSPSPNWANLEGQLKIQCHQVGTKSEFIVATPSMATSVNGWLFQHKSLLWSSSSPFLLLLYIDLNCPSYPLPSACGEFE